MSLLLAFMLIGQQLYELEEVVVTANRYPVLLQDVAVAVIVIEREAIENKSALGLVEILNDAAGIDLKDYGTPGGVTSVSLRGISSNGTLVLINGQPLNTVTNGMADLGAIDINTVERIEIVKGPVASIYGANAMGGVVNIITIRKLSRPAIAGQFTPSAMTLDDPLNTKDLSAQLGVPVRSTQLDLTGNYKNSQGYRSNSDLTQYHLTGSITNTGQRSTLGASLLYSEREYGIPGPMPWVDSLHPVPQFGDSTATSLFDREEDRVLMANLKAELQITDNIKWYNKFLADRKRTIFSTTYEGWLGDTISEEYDYLTHMIGLNTMLTVRAEKVNITIGFDARYDTLQTTMYSTQSTDTAWHAGSRNIGVWTEIGLRLSPAISGTSSLRYDHNSDFGGFLSPGIGIVTALSPASWLKLSAGKTFRAPTFNDLYWPQSGNPGLKPEHGWAYEIRAESSLRPDLFAALSVFLRRVMDRIAWLPDQDNLWRPQNVNYQSIRGLDLELKHQVNDLVEYKFACTYLNARQRNDEIVYDYYDWTADTSLTIAEEIERPAAFTPRYSASSSVNLKLPSDFGLNISGQYTTERINYYANYDAYPYVSMDTKTLAAYLVLNAALSKELSRHVRLTAGIKNLLDTRYALQFGNTLLDLNYPMPGRTYFLRLSLNSSE
ncbi:TonB-dependent receptor [candidate division WOR-3 bacterium]|nr:TonB-dependent receptor [candidate division WOR-3 bacterium]